MKQAISERIRDIMEYYNETKRSMSLKIGITPQSFDPILKGTVNPRFETIKQLLSVYTEISTDWLIHGKGKMLKVLPEQEKTENNDMIINMLMTKLSEQADKITEQAKQIGRLEALLEEKEKEVKKIVSGAAGSKSVHVG